MPMGHGLHWDMACTLRASGAQSALPHVTHTLSPAAVAMQDGAAATNVDTLERWRDAPRRGRGIGKRLTTSMDQHGVDCTGSNPFMPSFKIIQY